VLIIGPRSRPRAEGLVVGRLIGVGWAFLVLAGTVVERPRAGAEPRDLGTSCTLAALAVEGRDFA
jgi:uncharacterized protein (AIM24 family)